MVRQRVVIVTVGVAGLAGFVLLALPGGGVSR